MESGDWTWLEVAKLSVGLLTPALLFGLGVIVNRAARRVEDAQWFSRKIVEKRLDLYEELAPVLNDIYCFFALRGHFVSIAPQDVLDYKRKADKLFHVHKALFQVPFQTAYMRFITTCFKEDNTVGVPAKLKANPEVQKAERGGAWNDA